MGSHDIVWYDAHFKRLSIIRTVLHIAWYDAPKPFLSLGGKLLSYGYILSPLLCLLIVYFVCPKHLLFSVIFSMFMQYFVGFFYLLV